MLGLKIQTKLHEVMMVLECKNDTNTPAVLEVWVSEVGPGLGKRGREPTERWQIEGFFPSFIYISNDDHF